MFRFTSGKRFVCAVSVWRRVHQTTRPVNHQTRSQLLVQPQSSSVFKSPTVRPVTWFSHRLCHGDSDRTNTDRGLSLKVLTQAPRPALYLGFSGLIPFLSAPVFMVATHSFCPEVAFAQVVYGACIVSFLGGARWGFAIPAGSPAQPDWMNLGNSVVPSLLAWLALLCRDNITEAALLVVMGLGLSLHYDLTLLPGYPAWFKAMRTVLTLVATFSLVATLAIKKLYTEKKFRE